MKIGKLSLHTNIKNSKYVQNNIKRANPLINDKSAEKAGTVALVVLSAPAIAVIMAGAGVSWMMEKVWGFFHK